MESMRNFFRSSPIAKAVRLPGKVLVYRESVVGKRILQNIEDGKLDMHQVRDGFYSLEIGGEIVASGRIVRRRGRWYFKVAEAYS